MAGTYGKEKKRESAYPGWLTGGTQVETQAGRALRPACTVQGWACP